MPINSRAKGQRGEYKVRDLLREHTGLAWERVPSSGALSYLKTDLYIPHCENQFAVEVKNYEEQAVDLRVLTNKSNTFTGWWEKLIEQASYRDQTPLLVFKHSRSKWFAAVQDKPKYVEKYLELSWLGAYVLLFEEWLQNETKGTKWVKPSTK